MSLTAEQYLAQVQPAELFARLRVPDPATLAANVAYFTEKEARERDRIVLGHLGDEGVRKVTDALVEGLLPAGALNPAPALLDVGAGSGFFTRRVDEALRSKGLRPHLYAMDATPAMLRALAQKPFRAVPFLGALEDIAGSVRLAAETQPVPGLFQGAMSTLALHHATDPALFFEGAARVLQPGAPMVVVDMVQHPHAHFRQTMGDVHLGFEPADVEALAAEHFHEAAARKLPDTCCTTEGEKVELFALELRR